MEEFIIPIKTEINRFKCHLDVPDNSRIFFSGVFGIGKTHFLQFFFSEQEDYESVFLRPVHYSITNNDDIINYIKYDICFELLAKGIDFEKTEFPKILSAQLFVKENLKETLSILLKMTESIGKPFHDIGNGIKKLYEKIDQHQESLKTDEKAEIFDFLKEITGKEGSIYHEDNIINLIHDLLWSLKNTEDSDSEIVNEKNKKTVLVIDDLDRLDPEHIFRILNVFACHFDLNTGRENKFGFDKVVLVGDEVNIRSIFQAKYGINTDINGYLDKFFSTEIYYFDNEKAVSDYLYSYLTGLKVGNRLALRNEPSVFFHLLLVLTRELVHQGLLNVRTLKSSFKKENNLKTKFLKINKDNKTFISNQLPMIYVFDLLVSIYGSINTFNDVLKKFAQKKPFSTLKRVAVLDPIISLLDCRNHAGKIGKHIYENETLNIKIKYSIYENSGDMIIADSIQMSVLTNEEELEAIPFAHLLLYAFQEYLTIQENMN